MSRTKGTDVVALREVFKLQGAAVENAFLAKLPDRLRDLYRQIVATSWSEVADQMAIYQAAAEILFPGETNRMVRLGMLLAERSFTGIYKVFLRIPTIEFILGRAARIWNSYYDKGDATVVKVSAKCAELIVQNFPDLPRPMREVANGHYEVLLKMTGARNVRISLNEDDPSTWRWRISWD